MPAYTVKSEDLNNLILRYEQFRFLNTTCPSRCRARILLISILAGYARGIDNQFCLVYGSLYHSVADGAYGQTKYL